MKFKPKFIPIKKLIRGLILGGLLTMGGANALVYYMGHAALVDGARAKPAEAIVVLGALVFPDGALPITRGARWRPG